MEYTLIADAGSTKIDWVLVGSDRTGALRFGTTGLNALLADAAETSRVMLEAESRIPAGVNITEIHYYGAGCATPEICDKIRRALEETIGAGRVSVESDLLGAARSLLGDRRGIACILGTGSNSCLYDGSAIERNIPSLGFILGDEGSGASLGKRLVADAFKGHLPQTVAERFLEEYGLTLGEILDKVYRSPAPSRFLASLVPFIHGHLWNPYVYSLVMNEFRSFFTRNVSPYAGSRALPISFTGSIAFHFADILRKAADELGFTVGEITRQPLDGLIRYHSPNS